MFDLSVLIVAFAIEREPEDKEDKEGEDNTQEIEVEVCVQPIHVLHFALLL